MRSLEWLTTRAAWGLQKLGGNLLERVIQIAATRGTDATKKRSEEELRNCGFAPKEAELIAKSVRWASVIRKDYGEKAFWDFIAKVKSTE